MRDRSITRISRRALLGAGLFTGTSLLLKSCVGSSNSSPTATASESASTSGAVKEIVVGGPAGATDYLKADIFPLFEQKYNCRVLYEGTRSLVNLEKLRADRDAPQMSVVMMDDPVMILAQEENLISKLDANAIENLSKVEANAVVRDGMWANYQRPWAGVAFNKNQLANGITSWNDLWDSQYQGRVVIPSMQNTEGLWTFIMAAHLATGKPLQEAQYEVDAAFEKLQELKPNLLTIYTNAPQAINLLEQGEAWMIGGQFSAYTLIRTSEGAPIDLAAPSEGAFAMPSGIAKVQNCPEPELADALINEFLGTEYQAILAEKVFVEPTNPETPLPSGRSKQANLFLPDWEFVAKNREAWIDRWNREMAV